MNKFSSPREARQTERENTATKNLGEWLREMEKERGEGDKEEWKESKRKEKKENKKMSSAHYKVVSVVICHSRAYGFIALWLVQCIVPVARLKMLQWKWETE